jgi:hypothetical protein
MPSQVDLCNKALRRLGEDPIISLDNNTLWGRRCSAALPEVVRTVLSMDTWRSCTKRAELAAEASKPIGYTSAYQLPADCLTLAALKIGQYEDWSLEGNKILTQRARDTALEIMYVGDTVDPNVYTPSLYESIALGLAHEMSGYSAATNVAKDDIYALYANTLAMAQNINAKENPVKYLSSTSWVDARISQLDRSLYGNIADGGS